MAIITIFAAMKKAPEKAEETKRELEDAIKAHEEMLSQELHTIFLMERKRYTFFLRQISEALGNEAKALKLCEDAIEQCQQDIGGGLCADMEANFPEEVKKLIGPQVIHTLRNMSHSKKFVGQQN